MKNQNQITKDKEKGPDIKLVKKSGDSSLDSYIFVPVDRTVSSPELPILVYVMALIKFGLFFLYIFFACLELKPGFLPSSQNTV